MNAIVPFIVAGVIVIRIIWSLARRTQKPIGNNGLAIFYPLILYLALITFTASKLFVNQIGVLVLPPVTLISVFSTIILGGILAIPVLWTTDYEFRQNQIYIKKNKFFLFVFLGVIILRLALKNILYNLMPAMSLLFLTLVLATVYMMIWRIGCYVKFRRLVKNAGMN
ncbi:CcdC protein domain-containing protein [Desulfosporosinus sp. FKA]|uniref:CcdC protein domain-containing protein n=1 Tax=Desulfosporosinus sp. FKA TaxID=1969834 RepID=UPI000B49FA10|nr:CcdC protein domain-containing protein [Desulfosporosinus sp. FKA]